MYVVFRMDKMLEEDWAKPGESLGRVAYEFSMDIIRMGINSVGVTSA